MNICFIRGDTHEVICDLNYRMSAGDVGRLMLFNSFGDAVLKKDFTNTVQDEDGSIKIKILPEDTELLDETILFCEVEIVTVEGDVYTPIHCELALTADMITPANRAAEITPPSGGGSEDDSCAEISFEKIAAVVEKYLKDNPIQELDPTVPAWAKASEKPTYTAQEVGALPDTAVIDNESQITDDTLIVIDPDATPDKIPEWYNGTAITGVGSNILVAINGSASGDYYLNNNNGNVYRASAPDTWDYIGCLKGNDGSDSIYIGTEEEAANSSGATIWINPTTVTDEDYVTTLEISSLIKALGIGTVTYDEANEGYSMRIGDILIRTGMVHLTFPKADVAVAKTVSFTGDIFEAPDSSIDSSVQISPTVILVPWTAVPRYFSSSANPIISDGKVSAIKLVASRTAAFTSTVAFKWLAIGKLYKEV